MTEPESANKTADAPPGGGSESLGDMQPTTGSTSIRTSAEAPPDVRPSTGSKSLRAAAPEPPREDAHPSTDSKSLRAAAPELPRTGIESEYGAQPAGLRTEAADAARAVETSVAPLYVSPSGDDASSGLSGVESGLSSAESSALDAYEWLARSPRLGDLVALTQRIVTDAARSRAADWAFTSKVSAVATEMNLSRGDADTRFGNVFDVLSTGGEGSAERALAAALWAHAVAESPRARTEDEDRLAGDIVWLATHTSFDATPLLDRALGDESSDLWAAIADRVRRIEHGRGGALGRGEAVVACAALSLSAADKARSLTGDLAKEVRDPVLRRVLSTGLSSEPSELRLEGELLAAPRGAVATALFAVTGILFVSNAVRLFGRLALAYRRPAEVNLSSSGVRIKTRTEMLGRVLFEREHVIVRSGLVRVVREVRFPRAAFYAGLMALALGSYVGVRAFADGVRSASPSLLVVGLVVVSLGVVADFVLGTLVPGASGRVRVAFVPRSGPTLCVGNVDLRRADEVLSLVLKTR